MTTAPASKTRSSPRGTLRLTVCHFFVCRLRLTTTISRQVISIEFECKSRQSTSARLQRFTYFGSAKPGSLQRTVETVDNNELLSIIIPPTPTPSTDTVSFSIARLWSCASGFNTSFPSDTPVVACPSHSGELGAGLSQTWPSARSHCTSHNRRWYVYYRI